MTRMPTSRGLALLSAIAMTTLVAACSSSGRPQTVQAAVTAPSGSAAAEFVGTAPTGSSAVHMLPEYGGQVELVPGTPYYAASGRTCRPFMARAAQGVVNHGVACLTTSGWRISPSIVAGEAR